MDYLYYIFGILIFIAVVLALEGGFLVWNTTRGPEAARIARRLRQMTARGEVQQASMIKHRILAKSPEMQRLLEKLPGVNSIDTLIMQSGLAWTVAFLLGCSLAGCFIGLLPGSYLGLGWMLRLGLAAAFGALPTLYARRAKTQRLRKIEDQLPDALDMMGRALRAGHAFPTAMKMVGEEASAPLCDEFRTAFDEVNFGFSMQEALTNMAARVPITDLRYFVVAVVIQRETGGNLAELLASISQIMRERIKLFAKVRVLTAEGRMSAWILSLLPFGAASLIHLTNPTFLAVLYTDPGGRKLTTFALCMMVTGILVMRKMIQIRV
jgi:tight adherence protein B